jgi:hypothetical protein
MEEDDRRHISTAEPEMHYPSRFFFPLSSASLKPNIVVSTQTQNKKGISL